MAEQLGLLAPTVGGAIFSTDRRYRYQLWRRFGAGPMVNFLMLNPSTADEHDNDPTIERCVRRSRAWGYGALVVTNLFACCATNPKELRWLAEPIGPDNDAHLLGAACSAQLVVCAWGGSSRQIRDRAAQVVTQLRYHRIPLHYLRRTGGEPQHPLYLPYDELPKLWLEAHHG